VKAPRILIAEDNRVNQVVVLRVLQTLLRGCRPDVVENGLQVGGARDARVAQGCLGSCSQRSGVHCG
jgi:CheY-like chemotaxis protein